MTTPTQGRRSLMGSLRCARLAKMSGNIIRTAVALGSFTLQTVTAESEADHQMRNLTL